MESHSYIPLDKIFHLSQYEKSEGAIKINEAN
jgi:hypothetical protein